MLIPLLLLLAGFVILIVGGELLVRGAVRVAERAGMSDLREGQKVQYDLEPGRDGKSAAENLVALD